MRFAFLQTGMTGYQHASLRALEAQGHEVLNVFPGTLRNAAFDNDAFAVDMKTFRWEGEPPASELARVIDDFDPDVVMMASWVQPAYKEIMARRRRRSLRVLFCSNVWEATPKQWLGRLTHRAYLRPFYDCVFVPGERSEWFARRLGFRGDQVIRGANSADVAVFDRGARDPDGLVAARRFLFTGRLMPYKAVDVLRDAWRRYTEQATDPWSLDVVGVGEMAAELEALPHVTMHGFVQPQKLAELMQASTALVLPSYIDFYGVVVHEAATAGQVLICSDGVGADPHLLQDGFNGWTVAAGEVDHLLDAMMRVTTLTPERLVSMSEGSRSLARRLSPEIWATNLAEQCERLRATGEYLDAPDLKTALLPGGAGRRASAPRYAPR